MMEHGVALLCFILACTAYIIDWVGYAIENDNIFKHQQKQNKIFIFLFKLKSNEEFKC